MFIPSATYRIQLHKGFSFRDLQRILEYVHTLGVDTIYASPIMQATPGSMHGYDVTDPHAINSELGSFDELKTIIKELRKKDMFWLQDIVPNHMAFHVMNFRLMDVLERGPYSPYYNYFDIDWDHPDQDLQGKVMVPFLGSDIDTCISEGQIKLSLSPEGVKINYFDTAYPLSLPAYQLLAEAFQAGAHSDISTILSKIHSAGARADYESWQSTKHSMIETICEVPEQAEAVESLLRTIHEDPERLKRILDLQHYRLCFWKETDKRINYRRFFTVNELICLRMEDDDVFSEYHRGLLRLYKDKLIDGVRIDHIDGLQDPAGYTQKLRATTGESVYIIAEKILEAREDMPSQWPLQGTSGYEFLSFLNRLLTHRKGARQLLTFYKEIVPEISDYHQLIFNSKKLILERYLVGEWDNLTHLFVSLRLADDLDHARIRSAIGLFMLCLPVYRIYPDTLPLKGKSLLTIHEAFDKALSADPDYSHELGYLRKLFTAVPDDLEMQDRVILFMKRLMQFTGPLTAKGVEDTTFYIFNPLISHDEVGDSPAALGMTIKRFHTKMQDRQNATPFSLNATATHDTKRGEDARVRINVLSRIPELWKDHVQQWININTPYRTHVGDKVAPQINDEYFIYQSMLGGFPEDFEVTAAWTERVQAYLVKALREAKVNTSWSDPDEAYEESCKQFIEKILDPGHAFIDSFIPFVKIVSEHAIVYSLTQTLIKLTAPGIPDIYQGCELWDLSFVDPDNRRPVDYDKRMEFLFQLVVRAETGYDAVFEYLRQNRSEGIEKLYVIWRTLRFRRVYPTLFVDGAYLPIAITGDEVKAAAYARTDGDAWAIVIFPFGLVKHETSATNEDTPEMFIILPENAPQRWHSVFTGEVFDGVNQIVLTEVFRHFPVALLVDDQTYADATRNRRDNI